MRKIKYLVPIVMLLFAGMANASVDMNSANANSANTKIITWAKGYSQQNESIAKGAIQTPDGGYLVGLDCYSGPCATIMKLGPNGFIKWQKSYSMMGLTTIQQTSDNGSIFAGQNSVCNKQCSTIIKVDSNGNVQWENDLLYSSQSPSTLVESIQQTSDGGYIVAGSAYGTITNYSTWVAKLSASGKIQWQKFFKNLGSNEANDIIQTSDGYIVSGLSSTNSLAHILAIKLDLLGNVVWQKTYVSDYGVVETTLGLTADGGYIIGGDIYTLKYFPAMLLKLDSKGDVQWSKAYSDAGAGIQINSIARASDGYLLSGYIYNGKDKAWIAKTDNNGSIQWQKTYGANNSDRIFSTINETSDGFIAAGATKQFDGKFDSWVVKLDPDGNLTTCPDIQRSSVLVSTPNVTVGTGGLTIGNNSFKYLADNSTVLSGSFNLIKEC